MKALTIWQPWASLVIVGAKPYEFRRWPAPRFLRGQRIAIHAASRPIRLEEVNEILGRITEGESALKEDLARPMLERLAAMPKKQAKVGLTLSAVLGTAILGEPVRCTELFAGTIDPDDIDPDMWAWPMNDIRQFKPPIDYRGAQGFWDFPAGMVPMPGVTA